MPIQQVNPVSLDVLLTYQQQGMAARSRGLDYASNPLLAADKMPRRTGEPIADWRQKAEAWLFGWLLEHAWSETETG